MKCLRSWFNSWSILFGISLVMLAATASASQLPDFTVLVERNSPAVVNISTTQKVSRDNSPGNGVPPNLNIPDLPEDSPWGDLFKHFFGEPGEGGPEPFDRQSLGSGFIIDSDGYIVTNHHVVRDAEEIVVTLSDRRQLPAKVIGSDARSDVALLKIDASGLPTLKTGKSKDLKVGEWVMAIGSPFGFDHSVSAGIVSAIGRNLPSENYVPFIQTDVAINPGNSGGPLFNLAGEVVGINSQIYTRSGGFMGLSFAIPIDVAMDVIKQIKGSGHVRRGWLGILIQDVNRELAESFGMKQPHGAAVLKLLPKSPAESAGIKVGDVITEFDGKTIYRSSDLPLVVGSTPIGKQVDMKLIREGKEKTLSIKVSELPNDEEIAKLDGKPKETSTNRLGLSVEDLTPEQRRQLELAENGVLVSNVVKGPAFSAGIRRGDVILRIENQDIRNAKQFHELIKSLPTEKSIPILVQRRGGPAFLAIRIPEKK